MKGTMQSWLFAACAAVGLGAGCSGSSDQVITGKVSAQSHAVAVRAVSGNKVITAGRVRSDGTFRLELPAGHNYRLEVLSSDGLSRPMLAAQGSVAKNLAFDVCQPVQPYDMGDCDQGSGNGGGGMCVPPTPPCMDPNGNPDPNCQPPPLCTDPTGMNCPPPPCTDPTGMNCPPPPPPNCDPTTGMGCPPPPPMCDPTTGMNCNPPPCNPMTDPNCGGTPPECDPNTGVMCPPPPCDPTQDPSCATPPPPCMDPTNMNTCNDPCVTDPNLCACGTVGGPTPTGMGGGGANGSDTMGCWPDPVPPCDMNGNCTCDDGGVFPANPPGNFGCGGPEPQ